MTEAIDGLARAVDNRSAAGSRQAALGVVRSALDLELRYRPVTDVDLARFDLWAAQVLVDAAAKDIAGINADAFTLGYVRDRILGSVDSTVLGRINTQFLALQVAATDENLPAVRDAAGQLRTIIASVRP